MAPKYEPYWLDTAPPFRAAEVKPIGGRFDVAVVGGGFTGLSAALASAGIKSITRIGDCNAPAAIVHATYAGYRYAQELDTLPENRLFRHELPSL